VIILVVDDYDDTREVVKLLLEMAGHIVIEAANGREAVEIATVSVPDLILMDLAMPVMDGLTATRMLRAQPETAAIRIVAVTANGNHPSWREAALLSGCDGCYGKPLAFESLSEIIGSA
jgi:two-component system, cell cycle response regulator DivK